jgi:hypothetical protein
MIRMINDEEIGKDVEGNGTSLGCAPGVTEESHAVDQP